MRCPKCGYISFDNLDTCLKCSKDISEATQAFQGSTLKVETPSFLKISAKEDDGLEIEGAAEMDGDIEFADPDLEILVDEDEDDEGGIDFNLDEDEDVNDDDAALAQEFGEVESFGDDDDDLDLSADLGQFEDVSEEDTFSFEDDDDAEEELETIPMDIPDELADISDLSPPDSSAAEEAVVEFEQAEKVEDQSPAEPEDDLDFSNMDMDFDFGDVDEAEDIAAMDESVASSDTKRAAGISPSDMDEDLNFDLDLGGLTIHEEGKS